VALVAFRLVSLDLRRPFVFSTTLAVIPHISLKVARGSGPLWARIALAAFLGLAPAVVLAFPISALVSTILPGLEIVPPGQKGKGARIVGVMGMALLTLGIGVVANQIS